MGSMNTHEIERLAGQLLAGELSVGDFARRLSGPAVADLGEAQLCLAFALPQLSYKLRDYWEAAAERLNADTIEEAICLAFRQTRSMAKAAALLTFSETTIRRKLHALGEPIQPPGGSNNPYGCKGNPHKDRSPLP